jgi:hypothetical protein
MALTLAEYAESKKLDIEVLKTRFGLTDGTYNSEPAVVIPYKDERGRIVATRYRTSMGGDGFRWQKGQHPTLYGLPQRGKSRRYIILVEGESDVHTLARYGILALGIPGANTWKPTWAKYMRDYERIGIVDEDEAGEQMIEKIKKDSRGLIDTGKLRRVRMPPPFKDPSDLHVHGAEGEFWNLFSAACVSAELISVDDDGDESDIVSASNIAPRRPEWVRRLHIPRGAATLIAGDPEAGKSKILADIAARISRGDLWPDATRAEQGHVVYVSGEGRDYDVTNHLAEANADMERVKVIRHRTLPDGRKRNFNFTKDLPWLGSKLASDTRAVIFDPLHAFTPGATETNSDVALREAVMTPLDDFAQRHRVAVICAHHLNKDETKSAGNRLLGSIAYRAAPRAVLVAAQWEDGRRFFGVLKLNDADRRSVHVQQYSIRDNPATEIGRVVWGERMPLTFTAEQILSPPKQKTQDEHADTDEVSPWLLSLFHAGPVSAAAIEKAVKTAGFRITEHALRAARHRLHLLAGREQREAGATWWKLPTQRFTWEPES